MKKENFIFTEAGVANEFGAFKAGQIRAFVPGEVTVHVERNKTMLPVSGLSKDDCRKYLARLQVFDITDGLKKGEMQDLLELCTEAVEKGVAIPDKPSPGKLIKLLGDEPQEDSKEVKENV